MALDDSDCSILSPDRLSTNQRAGFGPREPSGRAVLFLEVWIRIFFGGGGVEDEARGTGKDVNIYGENIDFFWENSLND